MQSWLISSNDITSYTPAADYWSVIALCRWQAPIPLSLLNMSVITSAPFLSPLDSPLYDLASQNLISFSDQKTLLVTPSGAELLSRTPIKMSQRGRMSLQLERVLSVPLRLALGAETENPLNRLLEHACCITHRAIVTESVWGPNLVSLVEQMLSRLNASLQKDPQVRIPSGISGSLHLRAQLLFADIIAITTHSSSGHAAFHFLDVLQQWVVAALNDKALS